MPLKVKGLLFNGQDSYLEVPNFSLYGKDEIMVESLIYVPSYQMRNNTKKSHMYGCQYPAPAYWNGLYLAPITTNYVISELYMFVTLYRSSDNTKIVYKYPVSKLNDFVHLAWGVSKSKKKTYFYIDGELVSSNDISSDLVNGYIIPTDDANINSFTIGANSTNAEFMRIITSYVRVYSRILSQDEIQSNMSNPYNPVSDGLELWLPIKNGYGNTIVDYSGNGNNGKVYNAMWVVEKQRGLTFCHSYVEVPDAPILRCDSNNEFTVACLANLRKVEGGLLARFIVRKATDWNEGFGLFYDTGGDYVCTRVCLNDATTILKTSISRLDGWHMYIGGYDGVNAKVGVDGKWINTVSNSIGLPMMDTTGFPVRIGGNGGSREINGEIASVYMWNRILSDDEILKLYINPDDPPAKENLVLWLPMKERKGNVIFDKSGNNNNGVVHNARWV